MNKRGTVQLFLILALPLLSFFRLSAQSANLPLGNPAYQLLERLELKSGRLNDTLFLDIQPLSRINIANYLHTLSLDSLKLTKADRYWLDYLREENLPYSDGNLNSSNKPLLKYFYRSKANLFQYNEPDFNVFVNPVIGWGYGREEGTNSRFLFRNTRGLEMRGNIDKKLGFYTYLTDNQASYPTFVNDYRKKYGAFPGQGLVKKFKNGPALDFFTTRGYITFSPTSHIHFQFGNDQNVIGNGYRSMLLSAFAKDYLFLKVNTRIWRFQYQNLFAQFNHDIDFNHVPFAKHYGAFHFLSFDAAKWFNVGVFEGIIFYDVKNDGRGFDFSYLNPVIFYRSVEHGLGSPDNAVVGSNFSFLPVKKLQFYGQVMFDEFILSHLRKMDNSWVNKYALQAGFKWIDIFGLPNVDWQTEYNLIRPYTYSHDSSAGSYSHFNQPLAHPLGANLQEIVNIIRINAYGPLLVQLKYVFLQHGNDTAGLNFGGNIFKSYTTYVSETAPLLQGLLTTTQYTEVQVSYQVRHNLFLDMTGMYYHETSKLATRNTTYIGAGLRLNFSYPNYQF